MTIRKTVLLIGLGSLGRKLALRMARMPGVGKLVLVSRSTGGVAWAELCGLCGDAEVAFERGDARDVDFVTELLVRHEPALIVQAGSLLSPFALYGHPRGEEASKAGFALHAAAQLPLILSTMRAVARAGTRCPVVNCSFPDLTNQVLAALGLAPTVGIGNVALIELLVRKRLAPRTQGAMPRIALVAHHAHALPLLRASAQQVIPEPILFLDDEARPWREYAARASRAWSGEEINVLTTEVAVPVMSALLDPDHHVDVCLPGPAGLPGGYPCSIRGGEVQLRLPAGLDLQTAVSTMRAAARADGIEEVSGTGVISFTEAFQRIVRPISAALCEPLHPEQALERFEVLRAAFNLNDGGVVSH